LLESQEPLVLLEKVFGFQKFRGQQAAVIDAIVAGKDALVLMPTGGGKSLCYQIPALVRRGVGIVISPLIALMQDQVNALQQNGIRAAFLNSSLMPDEIREIETDLANNALDLVYIAPERLMTERSLHLLNGCEIALFAIDEAHCVSQWGHDFRQDYMQLSVLHQRFPEIPRVALTATADDATRGEIISRLGLENAEKFVSGFDRPNIYYQITPKKKAKDQLLSFIRSKHADEAGIVYCLSRKKVDTLADWLQVRGISALPYHAGLDGETRRRHQHRFLMEDAVVIVATIAFGMGIDKSNVRFVAHMDLPKSLEAYYQETGRAGRDGLPADAWMVYGIQDVITLRQMVDGSEADESRKRIERHKLEAMLGLCEIIDCRRKALLRYFGDQLPDSCGACDNCVEPAETWDGTEAAQMALSCVYRTGQRFGVNYLIDVLVGKDDTRIRQYRHDKQSTFGIGHDLSTTQWRSLFRQLIVQGYMDIDFERFGALRLTQASRPVLRGEIRLRLRKDPRRAEKKRVREHSSFSEPLDRKLWEVLRAHRRKLADQQGVPPYVIFHDTTLVEMVDYKPQTRDDMHTLSGVGERKLEKYADAFIGVIKDFMLENMEI